MNTLHDTRRETGMSLIELMVGAAIGLIGIVIITDFIGPGGAGPDTLSVFSGSDNERALSTTLMETMLTSGADIKPDGYAGFEKDDFIVLQQVKPGPAYPCALYKVTGVDTTSGILKHDFDALSPWNPPGGGPLPTFDRDVTRIFNLGPRPNWKAFGIKYNAPTYDINYGKLQVTDQFKVLTVPGAQSEDLMDGIVDLQAQYGKDLNGNGVVESTEWTKVLSRNGPFVNFDAIDIIQVIAVRLAVLARDDHYHKPSTAGGPCEATTAANRPAWAGGAFLTFDAPGALPSCYKYRVFETVIPLRNMIWRPE